MTLLGPHIGAAWLGHKISQEIKEKQGRIRTWCRDKVIAIIPFYIKLLKIKLSKFMEILLLISCDLKW